MAKKNDKKKSCFIIMPIATPKSMLADYNNDEEHFKHVLEHSFVPAVEKAGFEPIKPIARGAENIHGRIINKLETSDLILCDMSTLNANVFFELGIRTSLNKPACLVRDDLTKKVPFDTTTIVHHTYKAALNLWEQEEEIDELTRHIGEAMETSDGKNTLWKYFGVSFVGVPTEQGGTQEQLALILSHIEGMRRETSRDDLIDTREDIPRSTESIRGIVKSIFGDAYIRTKFDHVKQKIVIHLNRNPMKGEFDDLIGEVEHRKFGAWDISFMVK